MHSSLFFKLFPPPKFMVMKHAGLEISDDAVRVLEYSGHSPNLRIVKHSSIELPEGVIDGGEIKDGLALGQHLVKLAKENNLSYVKVSISEEKSYLFQTGIPTIDPKAVAQNIEFKLEENVPLSASEAIFYFDILPVSVTGNDFKASISVVQKSYVENIISIIKTAGLLPIAFEIAPKSIARAVIPSLSDKTVMIVHIMNKKTGIYIVCGGVVCFTSTISWGNKSSLAGGDKSIDALSEEIIKVISYWSSHSSNFLQLEEIILVGNGALNVEGKLSEAVAPHNLAVHLGNIWTNAFSLDKYIPPIFKDESLDYAVVAGLATDL